MFGIPIDTIDYSAVVRFLATGVREGFALEFKSEFPPRFEKFLAAFANTYGGIILIGVNETSTGAAQVPLKGIELRPGLRERVLQIGLDSVYPPILPEVRVVEFKSTAELAEPDRAVVVIRVIESDVAPHAVDQRTTVYLRADNTSKGMERKATLEELEWFLNKRQRSREEKSRLIHAATERAKELRPRRRSRKQTEQYRDEGSMMSLTVPTFPRGPLLDAKKMVCVVQNSKLDIPTTPNTLPVGRLQRVAGGVVFDGDYGSSEFQSQGLFLHEFDYWWDYYGRAVQPGGRVVYPSFTASAIFGTLELSRRIYREMGYAGVLDFRFQADGLKNAAFAEPGRKYTGEVPRLLEPEVVVQRRFSVGELEENLLNIARDCQSELYWAFGMDAPDQWLDLDFPNLQ